MIREPWDYDRHSHRVILNVSRRQRRDISIASNLLNRPRVVVLFVVIAVLIMLFLKEARQVLASSPQFMIQDIILENTNLITKDILKLEDTRGLFSISTKEIVNILKKDPDVESVCVEKILPGTLKIIINERIPYARLQEHLIDSKGVVLWRERPGVSVPAISGLKIKKLVSGELCTVPELQTILDILHTGDKVGWGRFIEINRIELDDEDSISIYTRERILVRLKPDNINEQLDRLMFVLNDAQRKGRLIRVVDLRFKDVYVE